MVKDDYAAAAGKHVDDAGVLLHGQRFDGAGYLAGYAVECVLKTLIKAEVGKGGQVPWIHDLDKLSSCAVRLVSQPKQRTARYVKHPGVTALKYGFPGGWEETLRYTAPGTVTESVASSWVQEARRLHIEVIVAMKLDGVIP